MKRLALTEDNKFEYCDCVRNNVGRYVCNHKNHQRNDETEEQFRKELIMFLKLKII